MNDVIMTFLALCGATTLWVIGIMWYLDLWDTKKENKDEPPTFI